MKGHTISPKTKFEDYASYEIPSRDQVIRALKAASRPVDALADKAASYRDDELREYPKRKK